VDRTYESPLPYAPGDGTGDLRSGDTDTGDGDVVGAGRFRRDPDSPPVVGLGATPATRVAASPVAGPGEAAFADSDARRSRLGLGTLNMADPASSTAAGAADVTISVSETLRVSVTGAGDVKYYGNPPTIEKHVTGAGSIRHKD